MRTIDAVLRKYPWLFIPFFLGMAIVNAYLAFIHRDSRALRMFDGVFAILSLMCLFLSIFLLITRRTVNKNH